MLLLRNIGQRLFHNPLAISAAHQQLNITQTRTAVIYHLPRPTEVKRQRRQAFKTRTKTEAGRRYLMWRLLREIVANNMDSPAIKRAILVMSGKGGVGKSTVASQLAITLALRKLKIGLLDVDICGPSLARMLNKEHGEIIQTEKGWMPVKVRDDIELYLMSMAFLTSNKDAAVIWRGPKKHGMIERFITGVNWDQIDCLVVDTPPGTSDEHISLVEILRRQGIQVQVVLVTTPQIVACNDVRREISFCKTSQVEICGLIENMSGFTCPHCSECTKIFSSSGGKALCEMANIKFLGAIPIDPNLCQATETGRSFVEEFKNSQAACLFDEITTEMQSCS